jgi:glycosyltransferase involved in cell wall biosynthesis
MKESKADTSNAADAGAGTVLSVGMPLYNNARTVGRALESLLAQTERDLEIIVSDDGSTDDTRAIVDEYARRDSRIRVFYQQKNLNYGNFRFVLARARSPFFMFAAGDDWWEPHFARACLDALESAPSAVAAVCRVMMHPDDRPAFVSEFTRTLQGDAAARIFEYLSGPGDNSRMYGVFKTDVARRSFPRSDHHAYDWTFSAASLLRGEHVEVPLVGMHREVTPGARYIHYVRRDNRWPLDRLFPLAPMTRSLLLEHRIPRTRPVLRALWALNMSHHYWYIREYHPWMMRLHDLRRAIRHPLSRR